MFTYFMLSAVQAYFFMTESKVFCEKLKEILFCHSMHIPLQNSSWRIEPPWQYCACRMAFQFDALPTELFHPVGTMTPLLSMSDSDAADLAIVSCAWCLSQLRQSSQNSKHWFTTSFLQPLPYLVTPQGPENCQLTSSFLLVLKQYYVCYKQLK